MKLASRRARYVATAKTGSPSIATGFVPMRASWARSTFSLPTRSASCRCPARHRARTPTISRNVEGRRVCATASGATVRSCFANREIINPSSLMRSGNVLHRDLPSIESAMQFPTTESVVEFVNVLHVRQCSIAIMDRFGSYTTVGKHAWMAFESDRVIAARQPYCMRTSASMYTRIWPTACVSPVLSALGLCPSGRSVTCSSALA